MTRGLGPVLVAAFALLAFAPAPFAASGPNRAADQLERRGVHDKRVLDAFRHVRRDVFEATDGDGPQGTLPPNVVAAMIEGLGLRGDERVLAVGTGPGYHAAILGELAGEVYAIEPEPPLAASSRLRLTREDYRNVHVKQGPGGAGWREYGPYKAIIVFAAAPRVPQPLIDQLDEGGVLVMPLGEAREHQTMIRGVKRGGKLRSREMAEVQFTPVAIALKGGENVARPAAAPARDEHAVERETVERARGESHDADVEPSAPSRRDVDAERPEPSHHDVGADHREPSHPDAEAERHEPSRPAVDTERRERSRPETDVERYDDDNRDEERVRAPREPDVGRGDEHTYDDDERAHAVGPPASSEREVPPPAAAVRAPQEHREPEWRPDEDDEPAVHRPADVEHDLHGSADDERRARPDDFNEDRNDLDDSDPDTDTAPRHGE